MKVLGSKAFAWMLFFASLFWASLFPVVNVSSGELKPRSLFVDENAYMASILQPSKRHQHCLLPGEVVSSLEDIPSNFRSLLGNKIRCEFQSHIKTTICLVENRRRPTNEEAAVLVFPIAVGSNASALSVAMALELAKTLIDVPWSSRNHLLLFIPVATVFSPHLESWLDEHVGNVGGLHFGIIRESLVVTVRESSTKELRLLVVGPSGLLPNM
jgi:hypothetical protein